MTAYFKTGTFIDGVVSWHREEQKLGLESILAGDLVTDAMRKAKMLDIEVHVAPMTIEVPLGNGKVKKVKSKKGQLVMTGAPWVKGKYGVQLLNRQVTWYQPIQNRRYAEILDPLCETYQVVGTLMCGAVGEVTVIQMEMPEFYVGDRAEEGHQVFLTVAEDRRTGKKHYGVSITRVVCANTYAMALSGGLKSLPNTSNSDLMLQFRTQVEQAMIKQREIENQRLNEWFTTPSTPNMEVAVANALTPLPKKPGIIQMVDDAVLAGYNKGADNEVAGFISEKQRTAVRDYDAAMARYDSRTKEFFGNVAKFNDEHDYAANTKYGLLQAATGFVNHSEQLKSPEDVAMFNLFFGDRAKAVKDVMAVLSK